MKRFLKNNIVIICLTFFIPGIFAIFLRNTFADFQYLNKPPFSPPGILFPIVWSILYALMSASYIIVKNEDENNMKYYYFQLIINALWTPLFFGLKLYFIALLDLIVLLVSVIYMTYKFYKCNKITIYLLVPYIVWLLYAFYLNFFIFLNN